MSTDVETAEGWDGTEPIGGIGSGRFRWSPTWVAAWPQDERERFLQWCKDNPDAVIGTDQGDRTAAWLLDVIEQGGAGDPMTEEHARQTLRGYGWNV